MNGEIDQLFQSGPDAWINVLPRYQQEWIAELMTHGGSYEDAAEKWLTAKPGHTSPFGGQERPSLTVDKIWDEIAEFLCGGATYESARKSLQDRGAVAHWIVLSTLSQAIAPKLGLAGAALLPVVSLMLASLGRIVIEAWCKSRVEMKAD